MVHGAFLPVSDTRSFPTASARTLGATFDRAGTLRQMRPHTSFAWTPNAVDRTLPNKEGFGSTLDRWNHQISGVTTGGYTGLHTHTSTERFKSPAPGDYKASRHVASTSPRLQPNYKLGRASPSFSSASRRGVAPDGTFVATEFTRDPIRSLSPGMYNDGRSYERTMKWGATGLDENVSSGNFTSGTTRFVYPKGPPEPENTFNTIHSGCFSDQYARLNRTWTSPIGVDTQRCKSPGPNQFKEKRFQRKTLHVHTKAAGFLSQPSIAPGFKYDPSIPSRLSIDKASSNNSVHGHKASFRSNTERFSYQTNHSSVKDWKFYDSSCSVVPTIAHVTGKKKTISGFVGERSLIKRTNIGDFGSGGGGGMVGGAGPDKGGSSQFASSTKRFNKSKSVHTDHTCMPMVYSAGY